MTPRLWLHIGTPKTGSTALQHFGREHDAPLSDQGIRFIGLRNRSSLNKLAKALRTKNKRAAAELGAETEEKIATASGSAQDIVLSSEMLSTNGITGAMLRDVIPATATHPLHLVLYIRRQDQYLESLYFQRIKSGRESTPIRKFIARVRDRAGRYDKIVEEWSEGFPNATWHIRRYAPGQLTGGSVVTDFLSLLGAEELARDLQDSRSNQTPSAGQLELMRLMNGIRGFDAVAVGREMMPILGADKMAQGRQSLLSTEEKREIVAHYEEGNERLRARFFPEENSLFAVDDLTEEVPGQAPFSPEQAELLRAALVAVSKTHLR